MAKQKKHPRQLCRKFKGIWIPAEAWLDVGLSVMEKVFIAEIESLDVDNKGCFASNSYLAGFFGITAKRVSVIINKLIEKGVVSSTIDQAKGNVRHLRVLSLKTGIGLSPATGLVYPRKQGQAIPEKAERHNIDDNKGDNKGENPATPLSEKDERKKLENIVHSRKLEPEEKSRFSYLNSKKECPFLPSEFFKFFADQVLGRFDKYTITTVVLVDWHRQLFEKFGVDIAIAAVSDHAATKKGTGWQPSFATVIKIAQGIDVEQKRIAAGKIAAERRADTELQRQTEAKNNIETKYRPPVKEMTADELVEWREIYVGMNNNMMIIAIDKETGNRNRKLVAVGE